VILSGVVTLIIFLALTIWGQDYAIIIALICGIIDLVPFFGSGTILVPWAVIELFMTSYSKALFLLILALGLFLFRKLAEPKVVGNQTGLSPLLSLITIYVGMKLGGVVGMILMPILCMMIISLYRVGFFDPTLRDLKMLFQRVIQAAKIEDDQA
jgi:predicted PurR-regulated permease PerM